MYSIFLLIWQFAGASMAQIAAGSGSAHVLFLEGDTMSDLDPGASSDRFVWIAKRKAGFPKREP